jgi:hypothetical protein
MATTTIPQFYLGQPVNLVSRPGRGYVADTGPGPLVTVWTMTGVIVADRREVTILDESPKPEHLKNIAMAWLHELGQTLGAEEVLRLAMVQAGR